MEITCFAVTLSGLALRAFVASERLRAGRRRADAAPYGRLFCRRATRPRWCDIRCCVANTLSILALVRSALWNVIPATHRLLLTWYHHGASPRVKRRFCEHVRRYIRAWADHVPAVEPSDQAFTFDVPFRRQKVIMQESHGLPPWNSVFVLDTLEDSARLGSFHVDPYRSDHLVTSIPFLIV